MPPRMQGLFRPSFEGRRVYGRKLTFKFVVRFLGTEPRPKAIGCLTAVVTSSIGTRRTSIYSNGPPSGLPISRMFQSLKIPVPYCPYWMEPRRPHQSGQSQCGSTMHLAAPPNRSRLRTESRSGGGGGARHISWIETTRCRRDELPDPRRFVYRDGLLTSKSTPR